MDGKTLLGAFSAPERVELYAAIPNEALLAEVERRGLLSEVAGSITVATEVEAPSVRQQLLDSVGEGARLYTDTINGINQFRKTKNHIPTLQIGEYRERAEDLLTDDMVLAAGQLPVTPDRSLLLIPRLNRAITIEENVEAWKSAAGGRLWSWAGRMEYLKKFTANQLSGFDPAVEDQVEFEALPTAYDTAREGSVEQQNKRLEALKKDFPELDVTSIFNGAVLANKYLVKPRQFQDSYVRGINLEPVKVGGFGYVPDAFVDGGGSAFVNGSDVRDDFAARLLAREKL